MTLTAGCTSCGSDDDAVPEVDNTRLEAYAGQYARKIVAVADEPLRLDSMLLDVNARVTRLANDCGPDVAARFKSAVADTIKAISPTLHARLHTTTPPSSAYRRPR